MPNEDAIASPEPAEQPAPPVEAGTPFEAGRAAAQAGAPRSGNPHDGRSREGKVWGAGWDSVQIPGETSPEGEETVSPRARQEADVYVAKESFAWSGPDGENYQVHKGRTRVRAGHPLLAANPGYFELADVTVHYDIEQATAAPGEKRGA